MTSICTLAMISGNASRHLTLSYRSVPGLQKSSFDLLRSSTDKSFVRNLFTRHIELSAYRSLLSTRCALYLKDDKCSLNPTGIIAKKGLSTTADANTKSIKRKKYTPKIRMDFFFDTISPYSWIAFEILQRYKPVWNLDITYKPVFMAGLTKANNNKFLESLTKVLNKSNYIFQDVERAAAYYKVPLRLPESPFYLLGVSGSLKQQRFLTAVKINYPEYLEACSRQFWYRCWSEDMDATQESSLFVIGSRAGMKQEEIDDCVQKMNGDTVKDMLKSTTSEAVEKGAFGLPYIVINKGKDHLGIDDDTYFGSDRFEVMASKLDVEWLGPVPEPESFTPLKMAPDYTQKELFEELEHIGAIKTDFTIPDDTPTSQPTRPK